MNIKEEGLYDGMLKVSSFCSQICYICVTHSSHQQGSQRVQRSYYRNKGFFVLYAPCLLVESAIDE
jgi:hypothetical protein